jgi:hypothetical protein
VSGITGTQAELLYSLPAAVTKNTYTTIAPISALAATAPVAKIPGGYFSENPNPLGRCLYLKALGTIANTAAATFFPSLALDTTAGTALAPIAIYTAVAPTAAVTANWEMEAWITCQAFGETAGMTLQVNGKWAQTAVATGGVATTGLLNAQFSATLTALTPATTYWVELFGTWNASSASNTTTLQGMFLFGLNLPGQACPPGPPAGRPPPPRAAAQRAIRAPPVMLVRGGGMPASAPRLIAAHLLIVLPPSAGCPGRFLRGG